MAAQLQRLRANATSMSSFIAFRTAAIYISKPKLFRPFSQTRGVLRDATATSKDKESKDEEKGPFRDEKIKYRVVQLVDAETGKLTEPMTLRSLLISIDRRSKFVELMTHKPSPIVKIFDKYEVLTKERMAEHKVREDARNNVQKEVQLSWSASPEDLAHKIAKIRQELERGAKVDVVFTRKAGQVAVPLLEKMTRSQHVLDALADVAKEWKNREVRGNLTALFLQPTVETPEKKSRPPMAHLGPKPKGKEKRKKPPMVHKGVKAEKNKNVTDMYQGD